MTDHLDIQGTAVADTPMLVTLAVFAEKAGWKYQLPIDAIASMDWDGKHIVCLRPKLMPGADTSRLDEKSNTGYVQLDLTMDTPLPCEVLIKMQGRKAPVAHMLSIKVSDYSTLEQIKGPDLKPMFTIYDGQRKRS